MSSHWLENLRETFAANGQSTRTWEAGAGRLLVVPLGARILGCAMPNIPGNVFWHKPSLEDARGHLRFRGAVGGDRLWIAPEVGYMWEDLAEARRAPFETYELPAQMDPSEYQIVDEGDGHMELAADMRLRDHRLGKEIALRVTRRFETIEAPDVAMPLGVSVASFAIDNRIQATEGDPGALAGTWDLLQVPSGGELICPTMMPVDAPRSYYNDYARNLKADDDGVRFTIDGKGSIKFGLTAAQTTGRMGYYRRTDGGSTLIVRIFQTQPGDLYVDVPRDSDQIAGGDVLQSYNGGGFGEMEYHDPAIAYGETSHLRGGSCVTHVLSGPDDEVRRAGRLMLGLEI
jgi:hypothetical protein